MSLMGRLAAAAETKASETSVGSNSERATVALEAIATESTNLSYPERMRAACRTIAINAGKTPVSQQQSAFIESAGNLELTYSKSIEATAISRMINALS